MLAADAPLVTDWMQGWGEILSLPLSLGALVFTGWLLRHEINVRREEKADTDAAQARLVVGSLIDYDASGVDEDTGQRLGPVVGLKWLVKNYSAAPIFDVGVNVSTRSWDDRWIKFFQEDGPAASIVEDKVVGIVDITPVELDAEVPFSLLRFEVTAHFTDASGIRWRRPSNYPPQRIFDWDPPTKAQMRKYRINQRRRKSKWHIGRWKLWTQVKVLRTRKPADLEAYGTEYDDIPF